MLFHDVAEASATVAGTAARSAKIRVLADCLRRAETARDVTIVTAYLAGRLRQRRTGLGYAALRDLPDPAGAATLDLAEVDATFERLSGMAGKGSASTRRTGLVDLMRRATASEQRLLVGLVTGELRQGALDGVLTEAVAKAADVPATAVRRAVTVAGSLTAVATAVLTEGGGALSRFTLGVGTPLRPMLATPAPSMAAALQRAGTSGVGVEWKLDGIRVQVHHGPDGIAVFTRTLDDITDRVPEIVELVAGLATSSVVLDGEAIALDVNRRPLPFQQTASRTARRVDVAAARTTTPLSVYFFDCLSLDGRDLVGEPARERWEALTSVVPATSLAPRIVTDDADEAAAFFADALAAGHEGVVVKDLDADYQAGRRGAAWQKVKPRHTLDLAVIAAEWGHGRRQGWLSNLHLAARDPHGRYGPPGGFVMLGKTFKGMTDQMLTEQTTTLLSLAEGSTDQWSVPVRPGFVVEVAFDGIQASPRYPAGVALRFARVLRHRPDKSSDEVDAIDAVLALRPAK